VDSGLVISLRRMSTMLNGGETVTTIVELKPF
jgi:hypothetical protein